MANVSWFYNFFILLFFLFVFFCNTRKPSRSYIRVISLEWILSWVCTNPDCCHMLSKQTSFFLYPKCCLSKFVSFARFLLASLDWTRCYYTTQANCWKISVLSWVCEKNITKPLPGYTASYFVRYHCYAVMLGVLSYLPCVVTQQSFFSTCFFSKGH